VQEEVIPAASPLLRQLVAAYVREEIEFPFLKAVTLAQWLLESGRASSRLSRDYFNFAGLKWRSEMAGIAEPVSYLAHDGLCDYCRFASPSAFIHGYWRFMERKPYEGWKSQAVDATSYLGAIIPTYCPDPGYVERVLRLLPEAEQLLAEAAREEVERLEG
jgi:N-acetylmuramoyl-L-alanine amidase